MKKTLTVAVSALCLLMLLCSCAGKTSSETEAAAVTYADIYKANTYSAVTSAHSSVLLKDSEWADGEYVECTYYWNASGYAFDSFPYADADGNSARDLTYITDDGSYLYFEPMTAETATFDMLECYIESGASTVEGMAMFGLVSPEYNQTITECKKTDTGYEITGENSDASYLPNFYSAFFSEGKCAEGDKIQFKMVLNEKCEMLKYENYYVFADGSEPLKANYGEFVYDSSDCPDYMKNVNAVLEKGAKDTSVKVYTESGVIERKVYSDIFLLYTDYEVYSDAEYTDLLTDENGYYMFDTADDIAVYLKAPTTAK